MTDAQELPVETEIPIIPDERLRLIFTCCHPALSIESKVALTLKLFCGLTTAEIASAFLVSESTMAARLTRAKLKIKTRRIPYSVPTKGDLPERVDSVLSLLHLVFTTGHTAPSGAELVRRDLVERSLDLIRMLRELLAHDPDVRGLRRDREWNAPYTSSYVARKMVAKHFWRPVLKKFSLVSADKPLEIMASIC